MAVESQRRPSLNRGIQDVAVSIESQIPRPGPTESRTSEHPLPPVHACNSASAGMTRHGSCAIWVLDGNTNPAPIPTPPRAPFNPSAENDGKYSTVSVQAATSVLSLPTRHRGPRPQASDLERLDRLAHRDRDPLARRGRVSRVHLHARDLRRPRHVHDLARARVRHRRLRHDPLLRVRPRRAQPRRRVPRRRRRHRRGGVLRVPGQVPQQQLAVVAWRAPRRACEMRVVSGETGMGHALTVPRSCESDELQPSALICARCARSSMTGCPGLRMSRIWMSDESMWKVDM